ncbi:hypothetical protein JAAARDRAFT_61770 [Jaapia argillacea MUCL 33604]|uniref:Type 1 phosphatases regulator n=1 Tax=Jaapia argillacea MUCL 33604 TaxID=933084 RepID=A0A067PFY9_9AGAM|nr:hypothetical protein JAAARDRAFT_61770 [Jaapia argillacea MUCL 33604]
MAALATQTRASTATPTDASRTVTQPAEGSGNGPVGALRLRGGPRNGRRPTAHVAWTEDVIDNEHMGKKKTKICCIYHKPRRFDESSSDESSSDSDSDSSCDRPHSHRNHNHDRPRRRPSPDRDPGRGDNAGSGGMRDGGSGGGAVVNELPEEPEANAYERIPKGSKKGKMKADS